MHENAYRQYYFIQSFLSMQWTIIYWNKQKRDDQMRKHFWKIVIQNHSVLAHFHKPGYLSLSNSLVNISFQAMSSRNYLTNTQHIFKPN